jgi:hypothetical protein
MGQSRMAYVLCVEEGGTILAFACYSFGYTMPCVKKLLAAESTSRWQKYWLLNTNAPARHAVLWVKTAGSRVYL